MLKNNKWNALLAVIAVVTLTSLPGCYRKGENIPVNPPTESTYLVDAWTSFESGDFTAAEQAFKSSKDRDALNPEAFLGLGWTQARLLSFDKAISNFRIMQSITSDPALEADAHAGLAVCYAAMKNDDSAIENTQTALEMQPNYKFSHDNYVDAKALNIVLARSYLNKGDYLSAMNVVENNLESGFVDQLVSEGVLIKTNGMEASPILSTATPVDGQATLRLTKESNGKSVAIELVQVYAVKDASESVNYSIVDFQQGGSDIIFKGNPVPTSEDVFKIDLLYASNFTQFLSKLYEKIESLRGTIG